MIENMLVTSTASISRDTGQRLDLSDGTLSDVIRYDKQNYGWFVFVPPSPVIDELNLPDDLRRLLHYARDLQCDWVMLDRDAVTIDALPIYDW